jgi:PAS domain S-box-containing protein
MTTEAGSSDDRKFLAPSSVTTPVARILIVDDNTSKRMALKAALAPLGHVIVEADSGVAALRRVMENDFAVILMDVQMPEMNGFETVKLIRKRRQAEMTPIIFITSYTSEEIDQADHYAGGAVDFIFAPIPPPDLRAKVSFFAHTYLHAQRLAAQAEAVRMSVAQLQALTDAAPIGIYQTDAEHRYVYTNPRWSEITGIPAELAVGRAWSSVIKPEDGVCPEPDLSMVRTFTHRFEIQGYAPSRIGSITVQALPDRDGVAGGWVGTLADITAVTLAERALFEARDAALSASAMQRNFAASASHELRTPTASIVGFLEEVLLSTTIDDEDRELLEVAYRNAQRLTMLIDDLMVLDQCEIGAPTMHLEPTPLGPLMERILSTFATAAEAGGVQLNRTCDGAAPPAMADPARLEQAIMNLVGNAIKFTPSGGSVTVDVSAGDEGQVHVSVTDTGMGIEPDDCAKIFERFYRSRGATDKAIPGSGLGLAIAKVMVEAQSGTIAVTSRPGLGSSFVVTLPSAGPRS